MANYTIHIPEELYNRMKKHPEIKWSEILRQGIKEYLDILEFKYEMKSSELLSKLKVDLSKIPDELAIDFAIKSRS